MSTVEMAKFFRQIAMQTDRSLADRARLVILAEALERQAKAVSAGTASLSQP